MVTIGSVPKLGDATKDVVALQTALNSKKFGSLKVDGIFGKATRLAVIKAQMSIHTGGTGVIGPKTLALLDLEVVPVHPVTGRVAITRDLKTKSDRHLYPSMRLEIESHIFPNGSVPAFMSAKKANDPIADVYIYVAKTMGETMTVVEPTGNNTGPEVGEVQYTVDPHAMDHGNGNGDEWCNDWAETIFAIIEDFYQKESPVIASQSTQSTWRAATLVKGLTSLKPVAGALMEGQHTSSPGSGHAMPMFELSADGKTGQTSEGNSGNRMRIVTRSTSHNDSDLKTLGWIYIYPNNKLPA